MTNEELVALIQAGVNVNDNMGQLYEQNRGFISKLVFPYTRSYEMDDLMQEAYFGIAEAAHKYQPDQEVQFLTYAEYWIKQKVQRCIENNGRLKRIPVHILSLISKYQKIKVEFKTQYDTEPTDDEYCQRLYIRQNRLDSLRKYMMESNVISFDEMVPGTDDVLFGETIPDDFDLEDHVVREMAAEHGKQVLWDAVATLKDRQSATIKGRYKDGMTLEAVGKQLGITKEAVRQHESNAFRLLRKKQEVQESAMLLDYGPAYKWGFQKFKDKGCSSTEFLAIRNIERQEYIESITRSYEESLQKVKETKSALDELNAEFNSVFKRNLEAIKRNRGKQDEVSA